MDLQTIKKVIKILETEAEEKRAEGDLSGSMALIQAAMIILSHYEVSGVSK